MFKKAFERVCTSTVVVFPDPLSPLPPTSAATRTPESTLGASGLEGLEPKYHSIQFQKAQKSTLYQQIKEIFTWNIRFIDCAALVQEE
jgi:hypothetical protein